MSYQSIWIVKKNEILACAEKVKTANPAAWAEVKVPGQQSRTFISLVATECQKSVSETIGCNLKRGGPEVSIDVLAMPNDTGAVDATGTFAGLELIDIIAGAEGPDPSLVWGDVTQKTMDAGVPGGWLKSATPQPVPTPGCVFPPRDQGLLFFNDLDAKYKTKGYPATPYFVDKEGTSVWYAQYLLYRTQGLDHAAAQAKVFADIDAIWYP